MISSLMKRSNYNVIEEEDQQTGSRAGPMVGPPNPPPLLNDLEDEENEEEDEPEGSRSMFESAPPNHHGIAVSFKSGGEKDVELQSSCEDSNNHKWDHINDIDQFFAFIYEYYQQKGFICIALRSLFSLLRFAFVVLFSTFLLQCVDYDVLFYNRNTTMDGTPLPGKRKIQDSFIPQCHTRLNPLVMLALLLATLFWLVHAVRICCRLVQFYKIKQFFGGQLQIADAEMQNLTWAQVVQKLCQVQQRLHLIVNREEITPLDIYQRILRHKNYFVALVYHDILPPQIKLPLLGRVRYLSTGLRFNLDWFLFWGPWSPWKGPYALKEEYKEASQLSSISRQMQLTVAVMALANLIFFPFVFIYQVLFSFFSYSEHFQRDPNVFGMRKYTNYGREKLRHFNEMDHELEARLNRSYEFATRYTDQFISQLAKIVAKNTAFVAAAFFVVLCTLTAIDEDTLKIEHMTTLISLTGATVVICRVFIPSENLVLCQQFLMRQIVANIHYAPKSWLANAHSTEVHREFTQIFRLKTEFLVEELLSPLLTPYILYFCIWKRVPEIVTFLHENTVHLEGLGDVCSLVQMDITRDGDTRLASLNQSICLQQSTTGKDGQELRKRRNACGKVELSLLNFATQNPDWVPSKAAAEFIRNVRELVALEISNAGGNTAAGHPEDFNQQMQQMNNPTTSAGAPMHAQTLAFMQLQASHANSLRQMEQQMKGGNAGSTVDDSIFKFGQNGMDMMNKNSTASPNKQQQQIIVSSVLGDSQAASLSAQLPYAFADNSSRLLASSFITPSPLAAIIQPRAVQESNLRAAEMSLHALAVNHMLFLNNSLEQQLQHSRLLNNRAHRPTHGYGSILGSALRRGGYRSRHGGGSLAMDSLTDSNMWAVPAESSSQVVLQMSAIPPMTFTNNNNAARPRAFEEDDEEMPLPLREEQGHCCDDNIIAPIQNDNVGRKLRAVTRRGRDGSSSPVRATNSPIRQ